MTVKELANLLKKVPGKYDVLLFPSIFVSDENEEILPGIGYYDTDVEELIYLGEVNTVTEIDE